MAVSLIHVAAAVVLNSQGEVLISLRPEHVHQGGLWEFPGGKVEEGEDVRTALYRELHEELGINVQSARPLIRIPHDYGDKAVLLDVWLVKRFSGEVHGREGQQWQWVSRDVLRDYDFPAANKPIISAATLPDTYLVTPSPENDTHVFLAHLEASLRSGIKLVQLRAKHMETVQYAELASQALTLCRRYGARLLLNADPTLVRELGADGVHLTSERLMQCDERPLPAEWLVGASCHSEVEMAQAQRLGVDFAVLGPVLATASHPGAALLGWQRFKAMTDVATMPVYALGGMTNECLEQAYACGAQGIAAISGLWQE